MFSPIYYDEQFWTRFSGNEGFMCVELSLDLPG